MGEKTELKCDYEQVGKNKYVGFGIRHLQVVIMFVAVTVLYIIRSAMGVTVLAMTERQVMNYTDENSTLRPMTDNATDIKYSETYDWDEQIQGMILSAFFWGYTFNQIPGGVIAQKFGAKPILLGSLIVNGWICLGMPVLVKFGGWQAVVAMRFLTGLTQCLFPCCHALLGKWVPPQERTTLSNIAYSGVQIGTIISMPLCGMLSRTALGWKMTFYAMAGLAFTTAILWQLLSASSPAEHRLIKENERKYIEESLSSIDKKNSPPIPWKSIATSIPLAALLSAHIGTAWTFTIFFTYIPSYMNHVLNISLRDSGVLSALPFFVMWMMNLVMSFIFELIHNKNIVNLTTLRKVFNSIGHFGPALCIIVLSYLNEENKIMAIFVLCLAVGSQGGSLCGFMMNHLDLSPNHAGVMLGITNAISTVICSLGPTVAGLILGEHVTDISKWRILFFLSAAIGIVTNVIFVIWGTSEEQEWNDPDYKNKHELEVLKADAGSGNGKKQEQK